MAGLATIFLEEKFVFDRKEYRISKAGIVEALTVMCNRTFTSPLQNHNYLYQVMIGISDRERKGARDLEDKRQREREIKLNAQHPTSNVEHPMDKGMTAAEFKASRGIESLAEKIGKKISFRQD